MEKEKMKKISIRIPDKLYQELKQISEENGLTLSEVIRAKIQKNKRNLCNKKLTTEFLYQINRIGNNINQIAKYVNTKKSIDRLVVIQLTKIIEELKGL